MAHDRSRRLIIGLAAWLTIGGGGCSKAQPSNEEQTQAASGDAVDADGSSPTVREDRNVTGFRYLPTLRKAVPETGSAATILESERRSHGDLWIMVADVRPTVGLGIDVYHFAPRPDDAVLVPDGGPQRITGFDSDAGDDAQRAELRRTVAAPQTRTVRPPTGHARALVGADDPARVVELLAARSKVVKGLDADPAERARAFAELLGLVADGPFRRPATLHRIVNTFEGATFAEVVPDSETRLGLSVRLAEPDVVVEFERLPGSPPTGLVVKSIEDTDAAAQSPR